MISVQLAIGCLFKLFVLILSSFSFLYWECKTCHRNFPGQSYREMVIKKAFMYLQSKLMWVPLIYMTYISAVYTVCVAVNLWQECAGSHSGLLHTAHICRADVVKQLSQQGEKHLQTHTHPLHQQDAEIWCNQSSETTNEQYVRKRTQETKCLSIYYWPYILLTLPFLQIQDYLIEAGLPLSGI